MFSFMCNRRNTIGKTMGCHFPYYDGKLINMRKGVENTHVASGRVRWYGLIGRELGYSYQNSNATNP